MEFKDFAQDLIQDIKIDANQSGEGTAGAFVSYFADFFEDTDVIFDSFYLTYKEGVGKNNKKYRVDGYCWDENNQVMNLFISDFYYFNDLERPVIKSQLRTQFERLSYFAEFVISSGVTDLADPSTPLADLIDILQKKTKEIRRFRLFCLTDGTIAESVKKADFGTDAKIAGIPVEYNAWDISRVYRLVNSRGKKQVIELDLPRIPCIEVKPSHQSSYTSYLCAIEGNLLADIYDRYGSALLEKNVRSFLSTKRAVNKGIRSTILSEPEKFFAYNNGIAATALDVVTEQDGRGLYLTGVKDFQIINGGQTTASLLNARVKDKADLQHIIVQMKLTKISEMNDDATAEFVQNISRNSNSQNKVSDADFFANHPFHIRMEAHSKRAFAPAVGGKQYETLWFYERARGSYQQEQMKLTKAEKTNFQLKHPKEQVITKTDLAKFRNSWDELPYSVSKGAQTNFMKFAERIDGLWKKDDNIFSEQYYKDTVALAILFKRTEKLVSEQDWYNGGYRANIVCYSIALLHRFIERFHAGHVLDLKKIWDAQQISGYLLDIMRRLTFQVFKHITADDRPVDNVTQWCKQMLCWEKLAKSVDDGEDVFDTGAARDLLVDASVVKMAVKAAKKDQAFVSLVDKMKVVTESTTKDEWANIQLFIRIRDIHLDAKQQKALRAATNINWFPSDKQIEILYDILGFVKAEGYKKS